jgi:co-chaperonin GroES (HSP10)
MTTLKKLVQQINAENAPPDGWSLQDQVKDKPEEGKVYALTGGPGSRCIANGNTWAESEVTDADPAAGSSRDRGNY